MTKIVKFDEKSVAKVEEENAFTEFGNAVARKPQLIIGDILRFSKGEYKVGKDLPDGTEALAGMHLMYVGWIKWEDKKPVAQNMVRVGSGLKPLKRKALGDEPDGESEDP
jgi:hypothetical protein